MWTMTVNGFLSAVEHREDPSLLMVRARDEESLLRLASDLGRSPDEVYSSSLADYPYRLVVTKSEYASWLGEQVMAMDYDNFKSAAHERRGGRFTTFLHTVWVAGLALTDPAVRDANAAAQHVLDASRWAASPDVESRQLVQ